MKLRNKRTGDIWEFDGGFVMKASHETAKRAGTNSGSLTCYANSIAKLNEEWEDYEQAKPLIKDEKIRKAVRSWAEANNVTKVWHEGSSVGFCDGAVSIKFHELCWEEIPKGEYTIAELCGEEEE